MAKTAALPEVTQAPGAEPVAPSAASRSVNRSAAVTGYPLASGLVILIARTGTRFSAHAAVQTG